MSAETAYAALVDKVALLDDSDRALIAVTGDRALQMVNGLVTNAVEPLAEGRCVYAFMLTPRGRPLAEMRITPCPSAETDSWTGDVWLDSPATCAGALLDHLGRYIPPLYARVAPLPRVRIGLVGPLATAALEQLIDASRWELTFGGPAALDELQAASVLPREHEDRDSRPGVWLAGEAPILLVRRERIEGPGFDLYIPESRLSAIRPVLDEAVRELGGATATPETWDIVRVERGVPAYGREITLDNLPQETSQTERVISFEKGCYTGQEVVARIHYRGHVNRHLRGFAAVDPHTPLEADSPLFSEDREVARTTTTVVSPRLGPIALGYARRGIGSGQLLARASGGRPDVRVADLPFTIT